MPEIDSIYFVYLFVALAAGLFVEAVYLLFFTLALLPQERQSPAAADGGRRRTARRCWFNSGASAA